MTINEKYEKLSKSTGKPEESLDILIWDCFDYEIFKLKPSKSHRKWFKNYFEAEYPIDESELTKKLVKELKSCVKIRRDDRKFEEKMAEQRKKRGYSDKDTWSIRDWFLDIVPKMIQHMRDNLHGYPTPLVSYPVNSQAVVLSEEDKSNKAFIEWKETLDKMIFLLKEMNEETCSFKNEYQEEVDKAQEKFRKKYGWFGKDFEKINNIEPESKAGKRVYFYYDDPEHPEWKELNEKYHRVEQHKYYYMDKCREEFFTLFSKYFWEMWD